MNVSITSLRFSSLTHSPFFANHRYLKVTNTHFKNQAHQFFYSQINQKLYISKSSFSKFLTDAISLIKADSSQCPSATCTIEDDSFSSTPLTLSSVTDLTVHSCGFSGYNANSIISATASMNKLTFEYNCVTNINLDNQNAFFFNGAATQETFKFNGNSVYTTDATYDGSNFFSIQISHDCQFDEFNYTGARGFSFVQTSAVSAGAQGLYSFCTFYDCKVKGLMSYSSSLSINLALTYKHCLLNKVDLASQPVANANSPNLNILTTTFGDCGFYSISNVYTSNPLVSSGQTDRVVTNAYCDLNAQGALKITTGELAGGAFQDYSNYWSANFYTLTQEKYLTQMCHIYVTPTPLATPAKTPDPTVPPKSPSPSIPPQSPGPTTPPRTKSPSLEPGYTVGVAAAISVASLVVGIVVWFAIRPLCFTRKYPYLHYDF